MMLRAPSFEAIRVLKIADNSLDYSLGNTTKQALWLPTSREAKYKAKQAVDSFCVRAGDVLQAGVVYTGELTALSVGGFAALNMVFVARLARRRASACGAGCTPAPRRPARRSCEAAMDDGRATNADRLLLSARRSWNSAALRDRARSTLGAHSRRGRSRSRATATITWSCGSGGIRRRC